MANEASSSSSPLKQKQKQEDEEEEEEKEEIEEEELLKEAGSGWVEARTSCEHLNSLSPDLSHIPTPNTSCFRCQHPDENWLCLCCKDVLCSRFVNKHMLQHYQEKNHCLALSYSDLSVWCFSCDAYLDVQAIGQLRPVYGVAHLLKFGEAPPFRTIECMQACDNQAEVTIECVQMESQSSKKPFSGHRTKNFTMLEDENIVRAWLAVGRNDFVGKLQTGETMWERIRNVFNSLMGKVTDRNANALMCRWHVIQDAVIKFSGFLSTVEKTNQNGVNGAGQVHEAMQMYAAQNGPFKFETCWLILKDSPKWNEHMVAKSKFTKKQKQNVVVEYGGFVLGLSSNGSPAPSPMLTTPSQVPIDSNTEPFSPEQNRITCPNGRTPETPLSSAQTTPATCPTGRTPDTPPTLAQTTPRPTPLDAPLHSSDQNGVTRRIGRPTEDKRKKRKRDNDDQATVIMQEFLNTFKASLKKQEEIALREIELREQCARMRQYKEDDEIMEKDLSILSPVQQQFFAARQKEIWERWNKEGRFPPGPSGGEEVGVNSSDPSGGQLEDGGL